MKYNFEYLNEIDQKESSIFLTKKYKEDKKLHAQEVDDAIIIPFKKLDFTFGGVVDSKGTYVEASRDEDITASATNIKEYSKGLFNDIEKSEETVIYLGLNKHQWGHFITSTVSRLWYFVKNKDKNYKLAFLTGDYPFSSEEITGNYLQYFTELLGVEEKDLIHITKPTQFKKVIVPEISHIPQKYYTEEFKEYYDYVRDSVILDEPAYKKVYLTRTGNSTLDEHDFGEAQLRDTFEKNGFKVIEPSQLSIKQQVWIIKNADVIATVSGTLTHNMLFAKDGAELIILRRQGYPMLTHLFQGAINEIRNLKVYHIEASYRLLPVNGAGPNIFYISEEFRKYLQDYGYEYIPDIPNPNVIQRYLVLIWYLFRWLDIHCRQNPLRLKRLEGQFTDEAIEKYGYYREKMKFYDSEEGQKIRKIFYDIVYKYGGF